MDFSINYVLLEVAFPRKSCILVFQITRLFEIH